MIETLYFAIPGDLAARTGGYGYDRRLIEEIKRIGIHVEALVLDASFPFPNAEALQHAEQIFSALPDHALVLADGLAFGAMPQCANQHAKRLRFVALCHHPLALEAGLSAEQQQRFRESEQCALNAARGVIVTSAATAQTLTDLFAIPNSKVTVATPGTDPATFAACQGNPPVLLCVATLTPRKAHDVLIAALALVADLPWQARFAGAAHFDRQWSAQLRKQINTSGLDSRITLLGSVDDLSSEYLGADLFTLPSRFEGYGMVFAEALAHGLPIIAARAGAVADVVPESAGCLVPVDDVIALAQALRSVLTDQQLYSQLRTGAQVAAQTLPSWLDTGTTVVETLRRIDLEVESTI